MALRKFAAQTYYELLAKPNLPDVQEWGAQAVRGLLYGREGKKKENAGESSAAAP